MEVYEFLKAIKDGRGNKHSWSKAKIIIDRIKLFDMMLDGLHIGLSKVSDSDLKKISEMR